MSSLDKLIQDTSRLAAAAESQAAVIARLIPNVERLQDRYVEKLATIATLTDNLDATRAERDRLRTAGDALAEVVDDWPELVAAWQEARNA